MAHPETAVVRSEDQLDRKWDRCISDSLIKLGGGVGLGALFSLLFFKRRAWPILFGSGIGLGMSYSNCQHDLNSSYVARPARKWPVALTPKSATGPAKSDPAAVQPRSAMADHPPQFKETEIKDDVGATVSGSAGKKK